LTAAGYYHVARGFWEILGSLNAYPAIFLFTRMSALFAARSPERDREARTLFYSGQDKLLFIATPLGLGVLTASIRREGILTPLSCAELDERTEVVDGFKRRTSSRALSASSRSLSRS